MEKIVTLNLHVVSFTRDFRPKGQLPILPPGLRSVKNHLPKCTEKSTRMSFCLYQPAHIVVQFAMCKSNTLLYSLPKKIQGSFRSFKKPRLRSPAKDWALLVSYYFIKKKTHTKVKGAVRFFHGNDFTKDFGSVSSGVSPISRNPPILEFWQ